MKNHKGFTIVELLIGMTILAIVAVALTGFIVSSSKSYAASNTEIIVQQESQLAMNQISDVIIDTTRSVNYVGYSLDGSVSEQVIKDADFTIDVEDKSLVLYNGEVEYEVDENGEFVLDGDGNLVIATETDGSQKIDDGNGNMNYQIYWDKSEEKLFFTQIDISETDFSTGEEFVLAEYVKDFSVDLSQVEEKRVVQISISYGYNNKVYETSNNITIRNKVLVNSVNLVVNKSIELNIRSKEKVVVLEPGEDYYKFSTPIIDGRNIIDKSVTWSIPAEEQSKLTGGDTGFTDTANGIIHISSAEQANSFKVVVTTNAEDSAGNHASDEVTVYVKRAKSIYVYKSADDAGNGPNEISPGCTFTVTANVEGNKLDVTCSKCGDDTTMDRQVVSDGNPYGNPYVWHIYNEPGWDPSYWLSLIDSDEYSATYYLSPDAPDDGSHIYVIQCMSLLSTQGNDCGRHYDNWVPGAIELTVKKKADLSPDGNFKYGDEPLTLNWDYTESQAVICLRAKERKTGEVKVMIINSDGKNLRVGADVLGLSLDKEYDISMQVLECNLYKPGTVYEVERDKLVAEYNGNLDSTGAYIGTEYRASSMIVVPLEKPQITINYNGKDYVGTEVNISPISALNVPSDVLNSGIGCSITNISVTRNAAERVKNYSKANLYSGDGNKLYWFDESANSYVDETGRGEVGALKFDDCSIHKGDGLKVKLNMNGNAMDAVGSYYYIPFFRYENGTDAARFTVHYKDYEPDYDWHYYERPESKISFSVIAGGNLKLWANTDVNNNIFVNGEIYFPTPSDSSFRNWFTLNNSAVQTVTPSYNNYFKILESDGSVNKGVSITRMTCQYFPTGDYYVIELFYECKDILRNSKMEVSAGTFRCPAKGTEWNTVNAGTLDDQLRNGNTIVASNGTAQIEIGEYKYNAYIALPTESIFTDWWNGNYGFSSLDYIKNNSPVTAGSIQYATIPYIMKENGVPCVKSAQCKSGATCSYDEDSKTYELTIMYTPEGGSETTSTFTYTEGETRWELVPKS